jgi:hypothetical protein
MEAITLALGIASRSTPPAKSTTEEQATTPVEAGRSQ